MIDAYYWPTPNGWKLSIMLEECELDYRIVPVDIGGGGQFTPEFLRISPNNRMPAIVDHEPLAAASRWRCSRAARFSNTWPRRPASSCRVRRGNATGRCNGCIGRWRTSGR